MAIPEPIRARAIEAVARFCDNRVPAALQDQLRVDYVERGKTLTVRELRAPWREDYGPDWSVNPCAQMRFDAVNRLWTLYWADRNGRWHRYPDAQPTGEIEWLLREIDLDPNGAFWG